MNFVIFEQGFLLFFNFDIIDSSVVGRVKDKKNKKTNDVVESLSIIFQGTVDGRRKQRVTRFSMDSVEIRPSTFCMLRLRNDAPFFVSPFFEYPTLTILTKTPTPR